MAPPVPLEHFPGIPFEYKEMLKSKGISSSATFLQMARSVEQCKTLARSTGIPENRIREIRALCDLVRIMGMGPQVARGFYQAGIRSVSQMAGADCRSLRDTIQTLSGPGTGEISSLDHSEIEEYLRCAGIIAESDRKQKS